MKNKYIIFAICISLTLIVGCSNSKDVPNTNNEATTNLDTQLEVTSDLQESSKEETQNDNKESFSNDNIDLLAMVDEITSKVEWASLTQIEDADLINEFFTLDANNPNYKQLLVMQCPMSAVIAEIILIQTDDVSSAIEDLNTRREKLINTDAYYPEHKEIAENSIIGSNENVVYFIAGENAEDSEKALIDYINSNGS